MNVEVVVVGGGVAGTAAAAALARRGVAVVQLLDDGPAASLLAPGHGLVGVVEPPHRTARSLGPRRMGELVALVERSRDALGALANPGPAWVAGRPDEVPSLAEDRAALAAHGVATAHADTPLGPGWTASAAFVVHPPSALAALAAGVRDRRPHHRVTAVRSVRDGLRVVAGTPGGEVELDCEIVVLAPGWRAPTLDPWFDERVVPVREQAVRAPGVAAPLRFGAGWTAVTAEGDHTWVAGCRWASPHLEVGETEPRTTAVVQARLEAFAARLGLGAVVERRAWIEAHTCDGLPFVGPLPGDPRRIALVGFCGNDWGLAPGAAEQVAEGLVEGRPTDVAFSPSR